MEEAEEGGTRNRRTVWSINTTPTNGSHIASFPEDLVEPCVLGSTQPGDFVLDPFFGCGTVGLVCRRLNRQFIGIELNAEYGDEAIELLEKQAINVNAIHRRFRYPAHKNAHQPTLLETPSKRRVVS